MRFKKGDSVEVMNRKDAIVSWRVAQILSGNGHTYRVKYVSYSRTTSGKIVETVSRKFLRPCPPLAQGSECCIVGDIVEVFDEYCWMVAAILKVLEKRENKRNKIYLQASVVPNQYMVRVLGSSQELIVDGSSIRVRQAWHDEKWIPMEKSSIGGKDYQKINFQIPQQFNARIKSQAREDYTYTPSEADFLESPIIYSRPLKRMSPFESSIIEAQIGRTQKYRAIEKGQNWRHLSFAS